MQRCPLEGKSSEDSESIKILCLKREEEREKKDIIHFQMRRILRTSTEL